MIVCFNFGDMSMLYSMSMSKKIVLVYRVTVSYRISTKFFSHYMSRKLGRVRNPGHNYWFCEDDFKISEPVTFPLVFNCPYVYKHYCHLLDSSSHSPTHGHLLVFFLGIGNNEDVLNQSLNFFSRPWSGNLVPQNSYINL